MGHSSYYPDDVTDEMIDHYFGADKPERCCENCRYYLSGDCTKIEYALTAEEADSMTQEEYDHLISRDLDDYCDNHEYKEEDAYYDD